MLDVPIKIEDKVKFILPIHDEQIIEIDNSLLEKCPELVLSIKRIMEEISPITRYNMVKTEVDVEYTTTNWSDKKSFPITADLIEQSELFWRHNVLPYEHLKLENPTEEQIEWFLQV